MGIKLERRKANPFRARLKELFDETEARKSAFVMTREEHEKLCDAAGAGRRQEPGTHQASPIQLSKFDEVFLLTTGLCFAIFVPGSRQSLRASRST